MPLPVSTSLLVKLGMPWDRTLCDVPPVLVQVQVTVWPTATVSAAGREPLCALWKKSLPTLTEPTGPGVGDGPVVPVPELSEQPRAAASTMDAAAARRPPSR